MKLGQMRKADLQDPFVADVRRLFAKMRKQSQYVDNFSDGQEWLCEKLRHIKHRTHSQNSRFEDFLMLTSLHDISEATLAS